MSESPKTPSPRIVNFSGVERIVPSTETLNMSSETLAQYQSDALEMLETLRQQVLDGQAIGFCCAVVAIEDDGCFALRQCSTSGSFALPFQSIAAIEFLKRSFHNNFFDE